MSTGIVVGLLIAGAFAAGCLLGYLRGKVVGKIERSKAPYPYNINADIVCPECPKVMRWWVSEQEAIKFVKGYKKAVCFNCRTDLTDTILAHPIGVRLRTGLEQKKAVAEMAREYNLARMQAYEEYAGVDCDHEDYIKDTPSVDLRATDVVTKPKTRKRSR